MKYIRTKDGRIIKIGEQTDIGYEKGTLEIHNKSGIVASYEPIEVLKIADTIEQLCDEFVIYDKDQNSGLPITCPRERLNEIKQYIQIGMQKQFNCWLKGAIFTDKGLIYVAKMNKKGELELL